MVFRVAWFLLIIPFTLAAPQVPSEPGQVWVSDILANPARHWNVTVTVVGQVQNVNANPPGTTRGTYTLLDDSSQTALTIRTRDLPPVGREFVVTGVIVQDPGQANVPVMNELSRGAGGGDTMLRNLLIAGTLLFVMLVGALVVMMGRKKPAPAVAAAAPTPFTPEPAASEPTRKASVDPTRKLDTGSGAGAAAPTDDSTKVFMSLGAEVKVDKGPDTGQTFPLHKQVTNIGRAGVRKNDIELSDDTVSKEQAAIFYDVKTTTFTLANQSTTNPTTVNNVVVADTVVLEPDAVIQMGATVLRFERE